jgi:hypothetical protein
MDEACPSVQMEARSACWFAEAWTLDQRLDFFFWSIEVFLLLLK